MNKIKEFFMYWPNDLGDVVIGLVGVGLLTILGFSVKFGFEDYSHRKMYKIAYSQMVNLADKKELHPEYGNNNSLFEREERSGVAKDLGIVLTEDQEIPYNGLVEYIKKYQPQK